jgi:DNA polymerase-3 subunit epsilon
MRQIILDTETTGLDPDLGHRIIELAAVEIVSRRFTGKHFHRYLNPERACDQGAMHVHGLTDEFLRDKPKFCDVVDEFLDFVRDAELIIHNAEFDTAFLCHELDRISRKPIHECCPSVIDTLRMARDLHPGKRNSLNALCERYQIDNSARTFHGALLDANLLAEVYLAMTRGQESLMIDMDAPAQISVSFAQGAESLALIILPASTDELAAHEQLLADIDKASKGATVWRRLTIEDRGLSSSILP